MDMGLGNVDEKMVRQGSLSVGNRCVDTRQARRWRRSRSYGEILYGNNYLVLVAKEGACSVWFGAIPVPSEVGEKWVK